MNNTPLSNDVIMKHIRASIQECNHVQQLVGILNLAGNLLNVTARDVEKIFEDEIRELSHKRSLHCPSVKLRIRNDRESLIATIELEYSTVSNNMFVLDKTDNGFFIDKIDGDDEGNTVYDIVIPVSGDLVEELSNDTLLEEIKNRMTD